MKSFNWVPEDAGPHCPMQITGNITLRCKDPGVQVVTQSMPSNAPCRVLGLFSIPH